MNKLQLKSATVTLSPMGPHGHASRATFDNYNEAYNHFVSLGVNSGLDNIETDPDSEMNLSAGGAGFDYKLDLVCEFYGS